MKKIILTLFCISVLFCVTSCEKVASPAAESSVPEPVVTEISESVTESNETSIADNNDSDATSEDTLGSALCSIFREEAEAGSDMKAIADKINSSERFSKYNFVIEECGEGYLPGFSEDVKGFKSGYKLQPMIGTIPFAVYVLETEDAEALLGTLNSLADPAWNICTQAEEVVSEVSGNYVFFALCPEEQK